MSITVGQAKHLAEKMQMNQIAIVVTIATSFKLKAARLIVESSAN